MNGARGCSRPSIASNTRRRAGDAPAPHPAVIVAPPAVTGAPPSVTAAPAFELTPATRAKWLQRATALTPAQVPGDLRVRELLHEAPQLAGYVDRYWEPTVDPFSKAVVLPGLESASTRTPRTAADELRELTTLTREAQDLWLQRSERAAGDPVTRGWAVLGELQAALGFLCDDGVEDARDAQLARVREAHAQDGESNEDLASALDDYAAVARPHTDAMHGVGGFDRALIEEAPRLAAALRGRPELQAEARADSGAAMALRNRYAALLAERMAAVRATARYVFRHHPKVAQEAGSAAARARAAASRRKKKGAKPAPPPADPT